MRLRVVLRADSSFWPGKTFPTLGKHKVRPFDFGEMVWHLTSSLQVLSRYYFWY